MFKIITQSKWLVLYTYKLLKETIYNFAGWISFNAFPLGKI